MPSEGFGFAPLPLLTAVNGFGAVIPKHVRQKPWHAERSHLARDRMGADEEVFRLTGYLYTDAPCSASPTSAITLPGRRTKIATAQKTVTAASHQQSVENAVW